MIYTYYKLGKNNYWFVGKRNVTTNKCCEM